MMQQIRFCKIRGFPFKSQFRSTLKCAISVSVLTGQLSADSFGKEQMAACRRLRSSLL
jgi:hypothetical protein